MALYKNVLHHKANITPKWVLEMIGVYVSLINQCSYCVDHHYEGLKRLIDDDEKSSTIRNALNAALKTGAVTTPVLSAKEIASLIYAAKLTKAPAAIGDADIEKLRAAGAVDEEILEINQVAAYFAYANRTVLGLGVKPDGGTLGLSPNNNADGNDWGHQ